MEAPEKIYLYPSDRAGEEYEDEWGDNPWGEGCVEYIRSDAFIEKACEWLKEQDEMVGISFTEDFITRFTNHLEGG